MDIFSASDARNRFGQLVDLAQTGPVRVQRHGRGMAIVMSLEEHRRMSEAARGKANPAVEKLHAESAKRWARVYEALAK